MRPPKHLWVLIGFVQIAVGGLCPLNAQTSTLSQFRPYALTFVSQIEQLNPNDTNDAYKIFLILRSPDVPAQQRKSLAMRILTGAYPCQPDFRWEATGSFSRGQGMFVAALVALSHMHVDDASLLPFLEEFLPKWERAASASPEEELPADLQRLRDRVSPDLALVRAVMARLKGVQAVPEVKTPADLQRRIDACLKAAGLTREALNSQYEAFMQAVRETREAAFATQSPFAMHLVNEIGRTLFHYAKRGMDVSELTQGEDRVAHALRTYASAGIAARTPQQLIDQLVASRGQDTATAQLIADAGVSIVPLIVQKLDAVRNERNAASNVGAGLGTLLEVLGTLIGKEALPYIEPFTQDNREWLRQRARQVKEAIEQGRVFGFYPDW